MGYEDKAFVRPIADGLRNGRFSCLGVPGTEKIILSLRKPFNVSSPGQVTDATDGNEAYPFTLTPETYSAVAAHQHSMAMLASLMRDKSLHETILLREYILQWKVVGIDHLCGISIMTITWTLGGRTCTGRNAGLHTCITTGCMRRPLA